VSGGYPHRLPDDPVLGAAARALEDGRLAGEVLDAGWCLLYVSSELRNLIGTDEDERLTFGVNAMVRSAAAPDVWRLSQRSQLEWWRREGPYMRFDLADDPESIDEQFGPLADQFRRLEPAEPPSAFAGKFTTTFPDGSEANVGRLVVRLNGSDGALAGILGIYVGGGLRGSVQAMLSRGDDGMFERMAALTDPARRPAAILFADLEASGTLSRRLSTKAYFELIRELTTAIDEAVIAGGGIVGKHVGDGVSAFFIAEQCGGEEAASAAALRAAAETQRRAGTLGPDGGGLAVNIGVHWGATLVIGQVVTGGRLEVTALGDEVTQAARVQEVARGGTTLATKDVIERLLPEAAGDLGLDPDSIGYRVLGEVEHAGEKARRDAGGLAVCELPAVPGSS
jgi:class 3 adenylate cyclase